MGGGSDIAVEKSFYCGVQYSTVLCDIRGNLMYCEIDALISWVSSKFGCLLLVLLGSGAAQRFG